MTKLLIAAVGVLAVTVAALSVYVIVDDGDAAAHSPIDCSFTMDTAPDPDAGTATCSGQIHSPFGGDHISFELLVTFNDTDGSGGPTHGDEVTRCHLEVGPPVNFSGDIHRGPCP